MAVEALNIMRGVAGKTIAVMSALVVEMIRPVAWRPAWFAV